MPTNKNVLINREKYIGGSDMPTILQFESAVKYGNSWEKLALAKLNISEDTFKGNRHTVFGSLIEELIREYINEKYKTTFKEGTRTDESRGYRANVDGYDEKRNILLEIKTYSFYKLFDWEYYLAQCQFYCEVYDVEEIWLVAYKKPIDFCTETKDSYLFDMTVYEKNVTLYKIKRDREYFSVMEYAINEFKKYFEELKIKLKEKK